MDGGDWFPALLGHPMAMDAHAMTDWEKRARKEDMFPHLAPDETIMASVAEWRRRALQLAREMADARAEEIAQAIEMQVRSPMCAAIARATIEEKSDVERFLDATREAADKHRPLDLAGIDEAAMRTARSAGARSEGPPSLDSEAGIRADERERIAKLAEQYGSGFLDKTRVAWL